jgi:hypothetical protein
MKNTTLKEIDEVTEDDFLDELDLEDFVFVIDREGNLKNLILPENYESMTIPDEISTLLQMYGLSVWNLNSIH